jgi:hypothetical protein
MKNKIYKRSGDHQMISVEAIPQGEIIKHNEKFVFGEGEASNHMHVITVPRTEDMEIIKDKNGNYYFNLLADGTLSHVIGDSTNTADHKTIPIKKDKYVQVHEREVDIFSQVVRKVLD